MSTTAKTELVSVERETLDRALVMIMAAERFFEVLAGVVPAPWQRFDDTVIELFLATGTLDADPSDPDSDFSPHYYEIERQAVEEARKGWEATWAHADTYGHSIDEARWIFCVPEWSD